MLFHLEWKVISISHNFYIFMLVCFTTTFAHRTCQHINPKPEDVSHTYLEPHHVLKKRSIDKPMRIVLYYDTSVYRLDQERFKVINNTVLPQAVSFWEKALLVRRAENIIRLARQCNDSQVFLKNGEIYCIDSCRKNTICGETDIPDDHLDVCRVCNATGQECRIYPGSKLGQGINNADFVLYISAVHTFRCEKFLTVAYATYCQQETGFDRPIAGQANICPESITTNRADIDTLLSTMKHEILHALGFSVSLYGYYRDSNGNPYTERDPQTGKPPVNEATSTYEWSDKVIKKIQRYWLVRTGYASRNFYMVVTPNVVREVRNHFNCSELEGAELEDQGGEGTMLTHWEKRVFENEAMTGTHTQNPVISRISLALMEDTGWYIANYSMAEKMSWGENLGCDFVMKSCKEWMTTRGSRGASIHPFCTKVKRERLETECTDDRSSVAVCNLQEYNESLPIIYQNFDTIPNESGKEEFFGGSVSLADYCPYIQEFNFQSRKITVRGSHCQYSENNPQPEKNFALEKYGSGSKCFQHSTCMWKEKTCNMVRKWMHCGSGCYTYQCRNGRIHIEVGNYSYQCYHAHQEVPIRIRNGDWLHIGGILCPPCKEICGKVFESRGEHCKKGEEAPPSNLYPRDDLACEPSSATKLSYTFILYILFVIEVI